MTKGKKNSGVNIAVFFCLLKVIAGEITPGDVAHNGASTCENNIRKVDPT
jgi:hypothetical protein